MNTKRLVLLTALLAIVVFALAAFLFTRNQETSPTVAVAAAPDDVLVRNHSPVIGPGDAPVTIVEFFDPSCETCRAFHPVVKQILAAYPDEVRLVIRYAAFHQGSDEAVRILEAARSQGKYLQILDALLAEQPRWAVHGAPDLSLAWGIAVNAGLSLTEARTYAGGDEAAAVLRQDTADVAELGITGTPTFFVNGQLLSSLGAQALADLVGAEVQRLR